MDNKKELVWHDYAEEEPPQGGSYLTVVLARANVHNF